MSTQPEGEVVDLVAALRATVDAAGERRRIHAYAAKIAAETIHYESPQPVDLSPAGVAAQLARCVRPPAPEDISAIIADFRRYYPNAVEVDG